jgi:hypothetical protein
MQQIGFQLIDQDTKILEEAKLNFAEIVGDGLWRVCKDLDEQKVKYPWLSTIDPYDDTIFNFRQIPFVVAELKRLSTEVNAQELAQKIDETIKFLEKIELHRYIRFTGD